VFVVRALRLRKGIGGGWRKPGPLAAAALVAMEDAAERFQRDHQHAKAFAHGCVYVHCIGLLPAIGISVLKVRCAPSSMILYFCICLYLVTLLFFLNVMIEKS